MKSRPGSTLLNIARRPRECRAVNVLVDDHHELGEHHLPHAPTAFITLRAWPGYALRIETMAQSWKTPSMGRSCRRSRAASGAGAAGTAARSPCPGSRPPWAAGRRPSPGRRRRALSWRSRGRPGSRRPASSSRCGRRRGPRAGLAHVDVALEHDSGVGRHLQVDGRALRRPRPARRAGSRRTVLVDARRQRRGGREVTAGSVPSATATSRRPPASRKLAAPSWCTCQCMPVVPARRPAGGTCRRCAAPGGLG